MRFMLDDILLHIWYNCFQSGPAPTSVPAGGDSSGGGDLMSAIRNFGGAGGGLKSVISLSLSLSLSHSLSQSVYSYFYVSSFLFHSFKLYPIVNNVINHDIDTKVTK